MSAKAPTWIVMVRDVSHAVRVANQPHVVASLALDADTGIVRRGSVPHEFAACEFPLADGLAATPSR